MSKANESIYPSRIVVDQQATEYGGARAWVTCEGGLTTLEYFAGLAMQKLLAANVETNESGSENVKTIATASVLLAKALIKELEKEQWGGE